MKGSGESSPLAGQTVITEGFVTGLYLYGGFNGFNIQMPGKPDLTDHSASTGLFIYDPGAKRPADLALGDSVIVTGVANDYYGKTQLKAAKVVKRVLPLSAVEPIKIEWPATDKERRRYEGMLVIPVGDIVVADNY